MFCFVWKVGLEKIVNEKGCLQAGEEWLEHNLLTVAGIAVGIAFLQVGNRSNPRSNHSYHCTGSTKYSRTFLHEHMPYVDSHVVAKRT